MHFSEKLDTAPLPKDHAPRIEKLLIATSVLGFLSMASIYLLFI